MPKRPQTVRELADEAEVDYEIALLTLWEAGLDHIEDIDSLIPQRSMRTARDALEIPSLRELKTVAYWRDLLGMAEHEFSEYVAGLGIVLSPGARTLPKGAIRRLRRATRQDPLVHHAQVRIAVERERDRIKTNTRSPTVSAPPLVWDTVGRARDVQHLAVEEVSSVHEALVRDFARSADPIEPPGVRSEHLLDSATHRPHTSLGSESKYPSVEMAAAALLHSVIHNHPFYNGNKRTALVSMLCVLDRNNLVLTCSETELFRFVLRVAQHGLVDRWLDQLADREVLAIAQWIKSNSRRLEKGERPIKWHELRRILSSFNCELESAAGVGNRINITRKVQPKRGILRRRPRVLRIQTHYADEGREVGRSQLNHIRRELELDAEHGVDSAIFYRGERRIDEFIDMYRKTLERLAKL